MDDARLRWILRRGMKELDVVVTRYYERRYPIAAEEEGSAFIKLLTQVEDPDIWNWILDSQQAPAEFADVIAQLRRHH